MRKHETMSPPAITVTLQDKLYQRGISMRFYRAFCFFRDNAGYVVGERAAGAIALARAETSAKSAGLVAMWEADSDTDWSFVDTWPEKDQKAFRASDHYAEACYIMRPCPEHGVKCPHADELAGPLCGIIDADKEYRRVIEAELFAEALANV